jgi:hypothetical protein
MNASDIIISERDRQLPFLTAFEAPFAYDGHPLVPLTSEAGQRRVNT